ncbi:MAG TPA: hypothetical protein VE130_03825 [Nitrososphaeraceae archaeon]|nr:hypothetical protein [Nitrososphaeraceae archaeon]
MPNSYSAGQDLFQQLSRHDQLIKRILWDEKYIDLHDKNRKCLIGISLYNTHSTATRYDYKKLLQKLNRDSRVNVQFKTDLSDVIHFIYTQSRIPLSSKIKMVYDDEQLLSIEKIDDNKDLASPPFSIMYIERNDCLKYSIAG